MNDIERLITRLPRPSPSEELDARIAGLIDSENGLETGADGPLAARPIPLHSPPADGVRTANRRLIVTAASTACAGLLGFVIGRHSVAPVVAGQAAIPGATVGAVAAPDGTPDVSNPAVSLRTERNIVNVQVPESEALVRFVMPAKQSVGLFGSGPLEERTESTQLE
jgi:hypothetical protein